MADAITGAISRVRVKKVQVVLSEARVVAGNQRSGLWPRITLELGARVRTFPVTGYCDPKKEAPGPDSHLRTGIGGEILKLAGGRTTAKIPRSRRQALEAAIALVNARVKKAIDAVVMRKGGIGERRRLAEKRALKKSVLRDASEFFEGLIARRRLELGDVRGTEVGKVWEDVLKLRAVRYVMET